MLDVLVSVFGFPHDMTLGNAEIDLMESYETKVQHVDKEEEVIDTRENAELEHEEKREEPLGIIHDLMESYETKVQHINEEEEVIDAMENAVLEHVDEEEEVIDAMEINELEHDEKR